MPLIFYSALIAAILTILGVQGLQHLGFDMIGANGAALGVAALVITHCLLVIAMSHKDGHQFDSENKARRLIGLSERRS